MVSSATQDLWLSSRDCLNILKYVIMFLMPQNLFLRIIWTVDPPEKHFPLVAFVTDFSLFPRKVITISCSPPSRHLGIQGTVAWLWHGETLLGEGQWPGIPGRVSVPVGRTVANHLRAPTHTWDCLVHRFWENVLSAALTRPRPIRMWHTFSLCSQGWAVTPLVTTPQAGGKAKSSVPTQSHKACDLRDTVPLYLYLSSTHTEFLDRNFWVQVDLGQKNSFL